MVSTDTPIAVRGNPVFSAFFSVTDTEATENGEGLLDDRRLAEYACTLPCRHWNGDVKRVRWRDRGSLERHDRVAQFHDVHRLDGSHPRRHRGVRVGRLRPSRRVVRTGEGTT